jgi:hypothetical protein
MTEQEEVFFDALIGNAAGFDGMWFFRGSGQLKIKQLWDLVLSGEAGGIIGDTVQKDGVLGKDEGAVDFNFLKSGSLDAWEGSGV